MNEDRRKPETVVVGRVRKPHGVRGEVAVEVLSDVEGRFTVGSELIVRQTDGRSRPVVILSARGQGEALIVQLDGCVTRDDVEPLRGALLEVRRCEVPRPPGGSYYEYELAGCVLHDESTGELGVVVDVIEDGGGWLLEVRRGPDRLLVPFVEAYLRKVDVEGGRIDVDLPANLIELCTSTS